VPAGRAADEFNTLLARAQYDCCTVPMTDLDSVVLPFLPYDKGYEFQWVREHRQEFTTVA
jgi:hypothetical protein